MKSPESLQRLLHTIEYSICAAVVRALDRKRLSGLITIGQGGKSLLGTGSGIFLIFRLIFLGQQVFMRIKFFCSQTSVLFAFQACTGHEEFFTAFWVLFTELFFNRSSRPTTCTEKLSRKAGRKAF